MNDQQLANSTPLELLRLAQGAARKEYDRAKAERDLASSDLSRAEQTMRIWDAQLNGLQRAIAAVGAVLPDQRQQP